MQPMPYAAPVAPADARTTPASVVDVELSLDATPADAPSRFADVFQAFEASECIERDAHLDIARTSSALSDALERALRPHGLTSAQYNVLRLLRAADPVGLCRNALRERLPSRMPDVTRLLDRMEVAGFVTRERSPQDRRLVTTRITARGRQAADQLDAEVRREHQRRLGHLEPTQLRTLVDLLARVRTGIEPVEPRPRRA